MRDYVKACAAHENAARTRWLLHKIVADREMHALLQSDRAMMDWIAVPNFLDTYK